ncbi:DUF5996 family protein [Constantimarinum furrinae]|uniref:Ava_C0101 and related proteins n=1 Tax=Constantimarinum furrinae TaxID=2562285 RepID=A0A7G8PS80_9FLAO|nr:DUF5996 family protein [Constantimarinum furrinae]QNJ97196.1 hypothetical protein ALE3EI_0618 [Constantimarinum furrinae]
MKNTFQLPQIPYVENEKSKLTLHLFLQIIGKIRLKMTPRKNHWWYITFYTDSLGLTTGPISYNLGMERVTFSFNFLNHRFEIINSQGKRQYIALENGLTVADFYLKLMTMLKDLEIDVQILDKPYDLGMDKRFSEITEFHHYNKEYSQNLWQILLWVDDVFKEFSGRFYGKTCPVHLYWHSMDLTVTRFSGKKAPAMPKEARISDKDAYTHECISFGFWAGDPNTPEAAFYSYTFPSPEGMKNETLQPASANWIDANGSAMAILTYNKLLQEQNPRTALLNFLESAYQAGAKRADWNIEELTVPSLEVLKNT